MSRSCFIKGFVAGVITDTITDYFFSNSGIKNEVLIKKFSNKINEIDKNHDGTISKKEIIQEIVKDINKK